MHALSPLMIGLFLVGHRGAILRVAGCRQAVWPGLLFVLSAGFAREYDGESLIDEPWHVLLPLVASLITSLILFWMVSVTVQRRSSAKNRVRVPYRTFLSLFWMTAPLAWLYAIPVESFMTAGEATRANLLLLAIVAVWRVVLMIRVIIVVYGASTVFDVICTVLLFGDIVMLTALFTMPTPIWQIMGGIRLTESESIILAVTLQSKGWGIVTFPVWLIGFGFAGYRKPAWPGRENREDTPVSVSPLSWCLAAASLLIWIPVLPATQPAQQLRFHVEQDLQHGRLDSALTTMGDHRQTDFPPHWDPPPRPGYGQHWPALDDVLERIADRTVTSAWVRRIYVDKFFSGIGDHLYYGRWSDNAWAPERMVTLLERIPEAREGLTKEKAQSLALLLDDEELPAPLIDRLRELLQPFGVLPSESDAQDEPETAGGQETSTTDGN